MCGIHRALERVMQIMMHAVGKARCIILSMICGLGTAWARSAVLWTVDRGELRTLVCSCNRHTCYAVALTCLNMHVACNHVYVCVCPRSKVQGQRSKVECVGSQRGMNVEGRVQRPRSKVKLCVIICMMCVMWCLVE